MIYLDKSVDFARVSLSNNALLRIDHEAIVQRMFLKNAILSMVLYIGVHHSKSEKGAFLNESHQSYINTAEEACSSRRRKNIRRHSYGLVYENHFLSLRQWQKQRRNRCMASSVLCVIGFGVRPTAGRVSRGLSFCNWIPCFSTPLYLLLSKNQRESFEKV